MNSLTPRGQGKSLAQISRNQIGGKFWEIIYMALVISLSERGQQIRPNPIHLPEFSYMRNKTISRTRGHLYYK